MRSLRQLSLHSRRLSLCFIFSLHWCRGTSTHTEPYMMNLTINSNRKCRNWPTHSYFQYPTYLKTIQLAITMLFNPMATTRITTLLTWICISKIFCLISQIWLAICTVYIIFHRSIHLKWKADIYLLANLLVKKSGRLWTTCTLQTANINTHHTVQKACHLVKEPITSLFLI